MYDTSSKRELINRLSALQDLSVELLKERNPNRLLSLIVKKAMDLLVGDGGSLYIKGEGDYLHFEVSKNTTMKYKFQKEQVPLDSKGLAVWCYLNCSPLRVEDVYNLPEDALYEFDDTLDKKTGYRTKSVLSYPLYSSQDQVLGVIQIINRKRKFKDDWPYKDEDKMAELDGFTEEDEELLRSFASIASAALENTGLYKNIKNLLEGFVKASVQAIESRDLATCGHSERVAMLTVGLAEIVNRSEDGKFRAIQFNDQQMEELRYASLLHDFGKIAVRENVLLKSHKLYDYEKMLIESRIREFGHVSEIKLMRELIELSREKERAPTEIEVARLHKEIEKIRGELDYYWEKIQLINMTSVLDKDNSAILNEILAKTYPVLEGHEKKNILTPQEIDFLSIKRGSLSAEEREEINKHVSYTYYFLKEIPWTPELRNLPDIAYAHHEKLDGSGYPRGLVDKEIPYQAKIMTITDIFDALVAMDRPYKKAVPISKALDILTMESNEGKLDSSLVDLFIETKLYENSRFLKKMKAPEQENIERKKKKKAA